MALLPAFAQVDDPRLRPTVPIVVDAEKIVFSVGRHKHVWDLF